MVNLSQDSIDEFRVRTALESALIQLDASWLILGDLRLGGPHDAPLADYAVLHPRHGVALIDVVHRRLGEPEQRLRKFLREQTFSARFPGTLPIVRLVLPPCDAAALERQLRAAFAQVAPLTIVDPDWVAAINSVLAPTALASTRPGFPLFRRPAPRRRAVPERDAVPPNEEPWNVSTASSPRPAEPRERAPEAAQHPAVGSDAAPSTADAAESKQRARPRRQPTASDEPTAGQQIQSLIELLRKNGVQRRATARLPQDELGDAGSGRAASADSGQSVQPGAAVPPPSRGDFGAEERTASPTVASRDASERMSPAAEATVPRRDGARAAEPEKVVPEEVVDDILSSTTTRSFDTAPLVDADDELPPVVVTPQTSADGLAAKAKDEMASGAPAPLVEPADSEAEDAEAEDEISARRVAAAPATDQEANYHEFTAESAEEAEIIEPEEARSEEIAEDTPPAIAARAVKAETSEAQPVTPPRAPSRVSSSIVVPAASHHPDAPDDALPDDALDAEDENDAAIEEDLSRTTFGELRATSEDRVSRPAMSSSAASRTLHRLSVRREDAISPPPIRPMRWRSGAAAAILLAAVIGGAAWLRVGAVPDWLPSVESPLAIVSALRSPTARPPAATPPAATSPAVTPPAAPAPAAESDVAAATPVPPPVPTPKPAPPTASPPPTPAAVQPPPEPAPTATASLTPPKVEAPPPPPAAKPAEPAKRPVARRAAPRPPNGNAPAGRSNAPASNGGDAAVAAALPPIPQGPPIDAGELPPMTPAALPSPAEPVAGEAGGAAGRLHPPTNLTPVWTKASTASAAAAASNGSIGDSCHNYTATRTLLGQPRQVSGLACRDGNGQWQIISELPR